MSGGRHCCIAGLFAGNLRTPRARPSSPPSDDVSNPSLISTLKPTFAGAMPWHDALEGGDTRGHTVSPSWPGRLIFPEESVEGKQTKQRLGLNLWGSQMTKFADELEQYNRGRCFRHGFRKRRIGNGAHSTTPGSTRRE